MTSFTVRKIVATTSVVLVTGLAGVWALGAFGGASATTTDGMQPYDAAKIAAALRATGYKIRMRPVSIPNDGVTKLVAAGQATSRGSNLNFAVVLRRDGFDSGSRPYWTPIVPGLDYESRDESWSNIEYLTDSGEAPPASSKDLQRKDLVRKRKMATAIYFALLKQIGAKPSDLH